MIKNYIFGYGSLMDTGNRSLTLPETREVLPVQVQGFERSWNVVSILRSFTVLGVMPSLGAYCTGIIFPVSEVELRKLDLREQKYDRVEIEAKNIKRSGAFQKLYQDGKIWTYIPEESQAVTSQYPIAQSYLDIVLRGSLEFGEDYARNFIRTTQDWSEYWVDDREEPKARRIMRNKELEQRIDRLLEEEIPDYFSQRV